MNLTPEEEDAIRSRLNTATSAAFAMIHAAVAEPDAADIRSMITTHVQGAASIGIPPAVALVDVTHALVWHAASALLRSTDNDISATLALVDDSAVLTSMEQFEHFEGEPND